MCMLCPGYELSRHFNDYCSLISTLAQSHSEVRSLEAPPNLYSVQCSRDMVAAYSKPPGSVSEDINAWCKQTKNKFGIRIGMSWGGAPKDVRDKWTLSNCNEIVQFGKVQSCHERWGHHFLNTWAKNRKVEVKGTSSVECITSSAANQFCKMENVTMDFGQARIAGSSRTFADGFITAYGPHVGSGSPPAPGFRYAPNSPLHCTRWETRPTFIYSNDDIFNLGHYMNDVMMVWSMLALSGYHGEEALLINMDGIRAGGPAGGGHRLMVPSQPDTHGPFGVYYDTWFDAVARGVDYKQDTICFREMYMQYFPGYPWHWNHWDTENECSYIGPSPMFQSFNLHVRARWMEQFGKQSLPDPPTEHVHILVMVRSVKSNKPGNQSSSRFITNLQALLDAIRRLALQIHVTVQDMANLSFPEQMALVHSAGVILSMHGAGAVHIHNAAIGKPNCCALIEMFPDTSVPFYHIKGIGNHARQLGAHYYRYQAENGRTTAAGTAVNVGAVASLVEKAVHDVRNKPSCVHPEATSETNKILTTKPLHVQ